MFFVKVAMAQQTLSLPDQRSEIDRKYLAVYEKEGEKFIGVNDYNFMFSTASTKYDFDANTLYSIANKAGIVKGTKISINSAPVSFESDSNFKILGIKKNANLVYLIFDNALIVSMPRTEFLEKFDLSYLQRFVYE
jgi:hypothetical protein